MAEKAAGYFISDAPKPPASEEVNIAALSRLFADTTTSYKYIFFLSILDILKRRQFDVVQPIAFEDLIIEMLANAWYPHTYFKLSFGSQDQIVQNLNALTLEIGEPILKFTDTDKKLLRATIAAQDLRAITRKLAKYVPFRLIAPFLERELQDVPNKHKGNTLDYAMPKVAENHFGDRKPLYRFNSEQYSACNAIILHPSWAAYLEKHYAIIRAWASWEWLSYMQRRNPNTPGLIHKLFAPSKRESLAKQTAYWKMVLSNMDFHCIYSGQPLTVNRFSLDHYVPWSFVAHDQLWNLIPTIPEVNSAKSNHLPPANRLKSFVEIQHRGLSISHEKMHSSWNKVVEPYIDGLGIHRRDDLLDLDKLRVAYENVIQPLFILAENQGFKRWNPPYSIPGAC